MDLQQAVMQLIEDYKKPTPVVDNESVKKEMASLKQALKREVEETAALQKKQDELHEQLEQLKKMVATINQLVSQSDAAPHPAKKFKTEPSTSSTPEETYCSLCGESETTSSHVMCKGVTDAVAKRRARRDARKQ